MDADKDTLKVSYQEDLATNASAVIQALTESGLSLTDEQKKIVDSKTIQILKKQGYFDLAPELREDMGYATASAMKEWTSSSTRTKMIDQDAFKKWERKAQEKSRLTPEIPDFQLKRYILPLCPDKETAVSPLTERLSRFRRGLRERR